MIFRWERQRKKQSKFIFSSSKEKIRQSSYTAVLITSAIDCFSMRSSNIIHQTTLDDIHFSINDGKLVKRERNKNEEAAPWGFIRHFTTTTTTTTPENSRLYESNRIWRMVYTEEWPCGGEKEKRPLESCFGVEKVKRDGRTDGGRRPETLGFCWFPSVEIGQVSRSDTEGVGWLFRLVAQRSVVRAKRPQHATTTNYLLMHLSPPFCPIDMEKWKINSTLFSFFFYFSFW